MKQTRMILNENVVTLSNKQNNTPKTEIEIYTDGACSFNPGPGGWGCVLLYKGVEKQFSGFDECTTNNRMEMLAVIMALKQLKKPCKITLYSDSAYVVNAFLQNWIDDWILKGWKSANKKPVKNVDLWQEMLMLLEPHDVTFVKVKGHADNKYNNICDKLARGEVDKWLAAHPDFKPVEQNEEK